MHPKTMQMILQLLVAGLGLFLVGGTLLNLSNHPHWFIRGWDFPRVQGAVLLLLCGAAWGVWFFDGHWYDWAFLAALLVALVIQVRRIAPYPPLAPRQVKRVPNKTGEHRGDNLRVVVSNVLMQNDQRRRWLDVIGSADPDVILALEINDAWLEDLHGLDAEYPHQILQPQDNMYGMAMFSRFKLHQPQVRFLVEEDTPSILTWVELVSGRRVRFYGLHPEPPEPLRGKHSEDRDAELVLVGREVVDREDEPTIVAGDLNDVAWSHTTNLFIRLSHLLDPRRGRGFYNTFHAEQPWFRFPLDHVFHSDHFELVELRRLPHVGSDHFPVFIELSLRPEDRDQQRHLDADADDREEAREMVERSDGASVAQLGEKT